MRLIGLTFDGDKGSGMAGWVEDQTRRAETIAAVRQLLEDKPEVYSGVWLNCPHGKSPVRRMVGFNRDGDELWSDWGGPGDAPMHEAVFEFAEFATLVVHIGIPTDAVYGLDAIDREAGRLGGLRAGHCISLDRSGSNDSRIVDVCASIIGEYGVECRVESRPLGEVLHTTLPHVTTQARAVAILQRGGNLPADDVIVTTRSPGHMNHFNAGLAALFESRGNRVVEPADLLGVVK